MNENSGQQPPFVQESEEQLRFALEGSNLGIWDWNIETGDVYFSPSWKRLFGFEQRDLTNRIEEWESRIHPDDRAQLSREIDTHLTGNQATYKNYYRLRASDGNYRWIEGRGKIVAWASDGRPARMIGTHTDITEQKESEEQYRNLFKITPLPTWIYDFNTLQFLAVNHVAISKYGYSREEFLNMSIFDIRPADQIAAMKAALATRDDTVVKAPWIHRKKNGELIIVELNSVTISYNGCKARLVVVNDITEKVAAEAELRRSNQQFLYASKATSDAIYDLDLTTNRLAWGDGLTTLFGYRITDVSQAAWEQYIHPDDRMEVLKSLSETIQHSRKKFLKMEYRFLTANGSYRYVVDKGFILRDDAGLPLRMIGAMQDITALKQKQMELVESNKRYEYATLAISDVIWDWVLADDAVLWSDNYEKVTGWKLPEDKHVPIDICVERFHPADRERALKSMNDAIDIQAQHIFEVELRYIKSNGETANMYNRAYILRNETGKAVRMIGAMQDITQRKKLEDQLLQEELDKQRVISKATIDTQERERNEIGKELHDNVNQVLTTTKLYLELALNHAEMKDDLLQKSQKNIMYVIDEIRQLSRSLMNPSLGDLGLVDSIQDLVENVRATGLRIDFSVCGLQAETLPEHLGLAIYRIIQEALNNIMKHAQAHVVSIRLQQKRGCLYLHITDDGTGFELAETKKGSGLKNIQNRVYLAHGSLDIVTKPGAGCALSIYFKI